jgi:hypothetical protein
LNKFEGQDEKRKDYYWNVILPNNLFGYQSIYNLIFEAKDAKVKHGAA